MAFHRFPATLNRGSWKNIDEPMLGIHKLRLENIIMYSVYLRDNMDAIASRKIKDASKYFISFITCTYIGEW